MKEAITKQQLEVLECFRTFVAEHKRSPTYREIQTRLGYGSPSSAYNRVQHLIARGYLAKSPDGDANTLYEPSGNQHQITIWLDQRGTLINVEAPKSIEVIVRRKT